MSRLPAFTLIALIAATALPAASFATSATPAPTPEWQQLTSGKIRVIFGTGRYRTSVSKGQLVVAASVPFVGLDGKIPEAKCTGTVGLQVKFRGAPVVNGTYPVIYRSRHCVVRMRVNLPLEVQGHSVFSQLTLVDSSTLTGANPSTPVVKRSMVDL